MKGANRAKAEKKKKAAGERKARISTRDSGYSAGRAFIPPWNPRPKFSPMLVLPSARWALWMAKLEAGLISKEQWQAEMAR